MRISIFHANLKAILDKYEHDPESLRAAGLAYAVDQIVDLVTQDVAGVHLYTMNNAETAKYIHQATHALFNHQSLGIIKANHSSQVRGMVPFNGKDRTFKKNMIK